MAKARNRARKILGERDFTESNIDFTDTLKSRVEKYEMPAIRVVVTVKLSVMAEVPDAKLGRQIKE